MSRSRPTGWDGLATAAVAFLAANLVHGLDHLPTGIDRLTLEVRGGGALITLAALGTVWLVRRRSSHAPVAATVVGLWSAVLIVSAHFAPHWSAFSDSYLDLSPDAFSWLAAGAEVAAAVALGCVGLRRVLAGRAATRLRGPAEGSAQGAVTMHR